MDPVEVDDRPDAAALEVEQVLVLTAASEDEATEEAERGIVVDGLRGQVPEEVARPGQPSGDLVDEGSVQLVVARQRPGVEEDARAEHGIGDRLVEPLAELGAPPREPLVPPRIGRHDVPGQRGCPAASSPETTC